MEIKQIVLKQKPKSLLRKFFPKKKRKFTINEVYNMDQLLRKARNAYHRNSLGEVIYENITVSTLDPPTLSWKRDAIQAAIKFLSEEQLINTYHQSLHQIGIRRQNIKYEIKITQKGIDLVNKNTFNNYFKNVIENEEKNNLEIREKKASIRSSNISFLALIVSLTTLLYTIYTSNESDINKVETMLLKNRLDSIQKLINNSIILPKGIKLKQSSKKDKSDK